jgi:hypothetical protein
MQSDMMESTHFDEEMEWPRLDGQSGEGDDWELLTPEEPQNEKGNEGQQIVVIETHHAKTLKHAASSPDFRHFGFLDAVTEDDKNKDDSSSFSMISGPRSEISVSSTFSFRDAIMSKAANSECNSEDQTPTSPNPKVQRQRSTFKPKFVVKPVKRCAKSTGDLQSLGMINEEEEALGATDAMEFYNRKAVGAKNRSNGLKLRPDEAKRLEITMSKKNEQRRSNADRGR